MNQEIFERVQKVIVEQLDKRPEEITLETNLAEDLQADSLDLVELAMALEQEFDVTIGEDEAEQVRTVADAVRLLTAKLGAENE